MAKEEAIRETRAKIAAGPEGTFPVEINYESVDEQKYEGILYFRVPTVRDTLLHGRNIARYLQGENVPGALDPALIPEAVKALADGVVAIEMYMVKGPEWAVKIASCEDPDVVLHVHNRFEFEKRKFRKAGKKPAVTGSGTAGGEA